MGDRGEGGVISEGAPDIMARLGPLTLKFDRATDAFF